MYKITIITATFNSEKLINNLADTIKKQTDKNFFWLIQDGLSTDNTINLIKKYNFDNIQIFSEKDNGIYDAFNKAISNCLSEYYLIVGSDDLLDPDAIKNFNLMLNKYSPDLIASKWKVGDKIYQPYKKLGWLKGMNGISSSHSVATLIKKDLHVKFGEYSLKFPICSDALFIKTCVYGKAKIIYADFISGIFNIGGFSSKNKFKTLKEQYEIQKLTEKFKILQTIIYILKLFKHKFLIR